MRRARKICGAGLVLLAALGLAGVTDGSTAGAAQNFRGVAAAEALRVQVTVPNFPVTSSVVDTSLYAVQAEVTSNNTSQAFASSPYPGDGVVSLPGTLAGFGAGGIPAYPLYASSVNPDRQHAQVGDGPFKLVADSAGKSSESSASSGVSGERNIGSAVSTASVKRADDGGVTSASSAKVEALEVQPLRIGSVVSTATTKLAPDGKLERSSALEVSGVTVNGMAVQLTHDGIVVGDKALPIDAKSVNDALAKARVRITWIDPQELPNGVVGAGVKITSGIEVPGSGVIDVAWTIGRSMAVIDAAGTADDVLSGVPAGDVAPAPPPGPPAEASSPAPAPAPADRDAAAVPATSAASSEAPLSTVRSSSSSSGYSAPSPASSANSSPSADTASAAPPAESAAAPAPPVALTPAPRPTSAKSVDSSAFFLLLVAGAAGVVVLSQVLSLLGVKLR